MVWKCGCDFEIDDKQVGYKKQEAKPPKFAETDQRWLCPRCWNDLDDIRSRVYEDLHITWLPQYCPYCGQKVNWNKVMGKEVGI